MSQDRIEDLLKDIKYAVENSGGASSGTIAANIVNVPTVNVSGTIFADIVNVENIRVMSGTIGALTNGTQKTRLIGTEIDYLPEYHGNSGEDIPVRVDSSGQMTIRGSIMTDEGSFRATFPGSSLSVSIGTCIFTNGSDIVTGTGFLSAIDLHRGDYVKLNADVGNFWKQIDSFTDTEITLTEPYTGTGGSGASSRALIKPVVGTDGSAITIASAQATMVSGTGNGVITEVERDVDILPLNIEAQLAISQRIANQNIYVGFYSEIFNPTRKSAQFLFDGTVNTIVKCVSQWSADATPTGNEIETTIVTLPTTAGVVITTATALRYRVELLLDRANFYIGGSLVATHRKAVPRPHDFMTASIRAQNNATVTSTNIVIDYILCNNYNRLSMGSSSDNDALTIQNNPGVLFTGTVTGNNQDFVVLDCLQYRALWLTYTTIGGGATIAIQGSNNPDFTTPAISTIPMYPAAGGAVVTSSNAVGHWVVPVPCRYIRIRSTAYTSGTPSVTVLALHQPPYVPDATQTVTASNLSCNVAQWGGQTAANGGINGTPSVGGLVAGDAGITVGTHKPVAIGGLAKNSTTVYTVSADADAVFTVHTLDGKQVIYPYAYPEMTWQYATPTGTAITGTGDVVLVANTAGQRNYVTGIQIINTHISVSTLVVVKDGSTVIWTGYVDSHEAGVPMTQTNITFPVPIRGSVNAALNFACITNGSNVYVSAQGFKGL